MNSEDYLNTYDSFGTSLGSKKEPTFLPNRVNSISGKQIGEGAALSSDLNIESGALWAYKETFDPTENNDGMRLGLDKFDSKAKFIIGDPSHYLLWDGNNATIRGKIFSTEGEIGGWVLSTDALTGDKVKLDSTGIITAGDFTGQRVEMSGSDNTLIFYDESGNERGRLFATDTALSLDPVIALTGSENVFIGVFDGGMGYYNLYIDTTGQATFNLPEVYVPGDLTVDGDAFFNDANFSNIGISGNIDLAGDFVGKPSLNINVVGCPIPTVRNAVEIIKNLPEIARLDDESEEKPHFGARDYISEIESPDEIKNDKGEVSLWPLIGVLTQALKDSIIKIDELEEKVAQLTK